MIRWIILILMILAAVVLFDATPPAAFACNGLLPSIESTIEDTDYIILGDIIDVDESGYNARVEVQSYLYGEPSAETIVLQTLSPQMRTFIRDDYYHTESCFSGAGSPLVEDTTVIILGKPNGNGVVYSNRIFRFKDEQEWRDFADQVTNIKGVSPQPPRTDMIAPRSANLLIQTENNSLYVLPLFENTPHLLAENVTDYSFSMPHIYIQQDETLRVIDAKTLDTWRGYDGEETYHLDSDGWGGEIIYFEPNCATCFRISDDGFSLAWEGNETLYFAQYFYRVAIFDLADTDLQGYLPSRHSMAIWQDDTLQVHYPETGQTGAYINTTYTFPEPIGSRFVEQGVWASSGRLLAFRAESGIWLYQTGMEEARLLLPTEGETIPIPLNFSPEGNFLGVQMGEERFFIDLRSGMHLTYGFVDRSEYLLYSPELEQFCNLVSSACYTPYYELYSAFLGDFFWLNTSPNYANWTCFNPGDCYFYSPVIPEDILGGNWNVGSMMAGLPEQNIFAVVNDVGGQISIWDGDVTSLSLELDSEISHIEWLPSPFYAD